MAVVAVTAGSISITSHGATLDTHVCGQWLNYPRGFTEQVVYHNHHAFLVINTKSKYFMSFDLADPANPRFVGGINVDCNPQDMAAAGDYVYIAGDKAGLVIIDVSDPTAPELVSSTPLLKLDNDESVYATKVKIRGSFAYVSCPYGGGLFVLDISDPLSPVVVSHIEAESSGMSGADFLGNYLAVLDGIKGVVIYDISTPSSPQKVAECSTPEAQIYFENIAVSGSHIFTYCDAGVIYTFDVSNPTEPQYADRYVVSEQWWDLQDIKANDNHLYVAGEYSGFIVLEIGVDGSLSEVGSFAFDGSDEGGALGVSLADNFALVNNYAYGVFVVDTTDAEHMEQLGVIVTEVYSQDVAVRDNYAYLADGKLGLQIIDISNPEAPVKVGNCLTGGSADTVVVGENYAYVFNFFSPVLLQVIDITDPANPQPCGSYADANIKSVEGVALQGNNLYFFLGFNDGLYHVDVSVPDNLQPCRIPLNAGYEFRSMVFSGGYAYLGVHYAGTQYWDGLKIVDLSDPATPAIVGEFEYNSNWGNNSVTDIAIAGSYAYITTAYDDLLIIDISDPTNPVERDRLNALNSNMIVSDGYAWFYSVWDGVDLMDMGDPVAPLWVGNCSKPESGGMSVAGRYAYLAAHSEGLIVVDRGNRAAPMLVNTIESEGYPVNALAILDNSLFMGGMMWGSAILAADITDPADVEFGGFLERDDSLSTSSIIAEDGYLYTASVSGLEFYDISEPDNIAAAVSVEIEEYLVTALGKKGNWLYVGLADWYDDIVAAGVRVFDVSNPLEPTAGISVGTFYSEQMVVLNDHLYVAAGYGGLQVLDISNPAAPAIGAQVKAESYINSVVAQGNLIYMLDVNRGRGIDQKPGVSGGVTPLRHGSKEGWNLVRIIDITDPAAPQEAGRFRYYGKGRDLAVKGDFLYIAADDAGIIVVNVAEPTQPFRATGIRELTEDIWSVSSTAKLAVSDTHLFAVSDNWSEAVWVYELMDFKGDDPDPENPDPEENVTTTTPVPVPHSWLDDHGLTLLGELGYETAAGRDSDGDGVPNWQEYVAGTDPNNPESRFIAYLENINGELVVRWVPDLGEKRKYTVEGKSSISDAEWESPATTDSRFFRVRVELP